MIEIKRKPERWLEKPREDLTGKIYGRLTVLSFAGWRLENNNKKGRRAMWLCECICGKTKEAQTGNLKFGSVKSCGCIAKEKLKNTHAKNVNPDAAFASVYREYNGSAKRQGRVFDLTSDQFKELTSKNCTYCGIEPQMVKCKNGSHVFKNSSYVYNGIDRIDNSIGYIIENCAPCCRNCNIAKGTKSVEEFLKWAQRLNDYQVKASKEMAAEERI